MRRWCLIGGEAQLIDGGLQGARAAVETVSSLKVGAGGIFAQCSHGKPRGYIGARRCSNFEQYAWASNMAKQYTRPAICCPHDHVSLGNSCGLPWGI